MNFGFKGFYAMFRFQSCRYYLLCLNNTHIYFYTIKRNSYILHIVNLFKYQFLCSLCGRTFNISKRQSIERGGVLGSSHVKKHDIYIKPKSYKKLDLLGKLIV